MTKLFDKSQEEDIHRLGREISVAAMRLMSPADDRVVDATVLLNALASALAHSISETMFNCPPHRVKEYKKGIRYMMEQLTEETIQKLEKYKA